MTSRDRKYLLIDNDNTSDVFERDGNSLLYFNDRTNATFYETYELVKKYKLASKCYFITQTHLWYQFIYKEGIVYQYSCDGVFIRRIEQVQRLSDEQVRTFIKVDVHAGTPSTDLQPNPIYDKWENDLFTELENGNTTVDNIKRIIYNTENLPHPPYLGGRWLSGYLKGFTKKYPQYIELIFNSTLPLPPHNIFQ
jgi:hypothetical protein